MAKSWTVRPSPIHGFGVFANHVMPEAFAVGALDCMKFSRADMKGEPATGVVSGPNQMAVMGGFPLWYLNYSDAPNVGVLRMHDDDLQPFVVTLRVVRQGEELTIANGMGVPLDELTEQRQCLALALADLDRLRGKIDNEDRRGDLDDAIRLIRQHDRWMGNI